MGSLLKDLYCDSYKYSDNSIKITVFRPNRQYKASTAEMA